RARVSLHIVGHAEPTADGTRLRRPSSATLLGRLWPCVSAQFEAALAGANGALPGPRPRAVLRRAPRRRLREDAVLPVAAAPPGGTPLPAPGEPGGSAVAYDWVGTLTRQAGILVHRWLKHIA